MVVQGLLNDILGELVRLPRQGLKLDLLNGQGRAAASTLPRAVQLPDCPVVRAGGEDASGAVALLEQARVVERRAVLFPMPSIRAIRPGHVKRLERVRSIHNLNALPDCDGNHCLIVGDMPDDVIGKLCLANNDVGSVSGSAGCKGIQERSLSQSNVPGTARK